MAIGPTLPPHLHAKRKRDSDDEEATLPSRDSSSPDANEKRRRTLGPSLPPAPLDERPVSPPKGTADADSDNGSSDSDDDYGPALPTSSTPQDAATQQAAFDDDDDVHSKPTARDSWMLKPPAQDDLTSRMNPSRARARKFNTGKAGRPPAGGSGEIDAIWTETPEQKAARLKNSVMGVSKGPTAAEAKVEGRSKADVETARRLEKARGKSLLEEHQGRQDVPEEDDPSKRAFHYSKDVGGVKVGRAQKAEMLGKARDFGSKFSGGSYL